MVKSFFPPKCRMKRARGSTTNKVAHLGGETSFTQMAATAVFGQMLQFEPCETIHSVFAKVKAGTVDAGVVPAESTTFGSFFSTLDEQLIHSMDVQICGEKMMQEKLALCSQINVSEINIDCIIAHPHVLECCSNYLELLDGRRAAAGKAKIERIPAMDSTKACQMIAESVVHSAAISNKETATRYGLVLLAEHVGNDMNGQTRYIILANKPRAAEVVKLLTSSGPRAALQQQRSSLVFGTTHQSGSIFRWSSCFALRNVNILRVECRPATTAMKMIGNPSQPFPLRHFEYICFIDYEKPGEDTNSALISNLQEREFTQFLIELGTYTRDTQSQGAAAKANPVWSEVAETFLH